MQSLLLLLLVVACAGQATLSTTATGLYARTTLTVCMPSDKPTSQPLPTGAYCRLVDSYGTVAYPTESVPQTSGPSFCVQAYVSDVFSNDMHQFRIYSASKTILGYSPQFRVYRFPFAPFLGQDAGGQIALLVRSRYYGPNGPLPFPYNSNDQLIFVAYNMYDGYIGSYAQRILGYDQVDPFVLFIPYIQSIWYIKMVFVSGLTGDQTPTISGFRRRIGEENMFDPMYKSF